MVSTGVAAGRQARHDRRRAAAAAVVPEGGYCYAIVGPAERGVRVAPYPYWKARGDWREQEYGYCRLLKVGDGTKGLDARGRPRATLLLWDQVKECGVNLGDEADGAPEAEV